MLGMIFWAKTNGIYIETVIFFLNMTIEEMVKTNFNQGDPVEMHESAESGISPLLVISKTTQEIE